MLVRKTAVWSPGAFLGTVGTDIGKQIKDLERQTIDCLKMPRMGYREGEGSLGRPG